MTKTFITDKDGATIDASTATVPSDRHFRNAWKLSGSVISEDMTEAKKIFIEKIREVRKPLLEAEDVVYMKALEASDSTAQAASVAKKKALRDAPAASAITNAATQMTNDIASLTKPLTRLIKPEMAIIMAIPVSATAISITYPLFRVRI